MLGRRPLEVNLLELPPLLDTVLGLNLLKLGLWVVVVAALVLDRVRVLPRLLEPNRDLLLELSPLLDVFCLTNLRLFELILFLELLVEGLLEAVDELLSLASPCGSLAL